MMNTMRIDFEMRQGVAVFTPAEPMVVGPDNARDLEQAVLAFVESSPLVILDARHVDFFESEGVDSLLLLQGRLAERNGRLALAGLKSHVAEIFRLNGLDCLFHIYPDVELAVRGLVRPSRPTDAWH